MEIDICSLNTSQKYDFVVIFARYDSHWLYSRHRERDTWETAGGHIEPGETPLEAARRELYEECGAVEFDIEPAFDYAVSGASEVSNGQVFFADVRRLGVLPDYEMAEVQLFDALPDKMTYPEILPVLYEKVQSLLVDRRPGAW